jgi:hypothetical protein
MAEKRSQGGSTIYRHNTPAPSPKDIAEADHTLISEHLQRHLGTEGSVWHEIASDRIHLDIHVTPASKERPYAVIATSGMSALPMAVPEDLPHREKWTHAELCMLLPADWPLTQSAFRDDNAYWPVRLLKQLGRLPHDYGTWLSWGHSVPNGDPAEPYADNTTLSGALVIPPYVLGTEFFELHRQQASAPTNLIHFFQVVPVYPEEMAFKLEHGIDSLIEKMAKCPGALDAMNPARSSSV